MAAVRGPATDSTTLLDDDEVTALFCYLEFLAHPDDLVRSARWLDCQQDYRAFNRARQADWHEQRMFGGRKSKLTRDRFAGEKSAVAGPLEKFDPEAIRKRHLTMATRHQKKQRDEKGQRMASQPVASVAAADPNPF